MTYGLGWEISREVVGNDHYCVLGKVVEFASMAAKWCFDPRHIPDVIVSKDTNVLKHSLYHEGAYSIVSELMAGRYFFEDQEWDVVFIGQVCSIFERCIAVESST